MTQQPRIIGLDIGDKRIGVAISDLLGLTATGVDTIERINMRKDIFAVMAMLRKHGANEVVVGLPKNMDGTIGEQALKVQAFCRKLARVSGLPIIYEDERLTTVTAIHTLTLLGVKTGNNKALVDRQAAAIILQQYLDRNYPSSSA